MPNMPIGRPMKYAPYLIILTDTLLYSPGVIAHFAEAFGFMDDIATDKRVDERRRVRHCLNRYRLNHDFPEAGDGQVGLVRQAAAKGWTGARWKAIMHAVTRETAMQVVTQMLKAQPGRHLILAIGYPIQVRKEQP